MLRCCSFASVVADEWWLMGHRQFLPLLNSPSLQSLLSSPRFRSDRLKGSIFAIHSFCCVITSEYTSCTHRPF